MQKQRTELNFKGQNLFVGIDVHLKCWTVTIMKSLIITYLKFGGRSL
jgi:transposase